VRRIVLDGELLAETGPFTTLMQRLHPAASRLEVLAHDLPRARDSVLARPPDPARTAATTSGKYRASGLPCRDWSSTSSPSRKTRQRKPSSFGS
jgi:hypothetical protein